MSTLSPSPLATTSLQPPLCNPAWLQALVATNYYCTTQSHMGAERSNLNSLSANASLDAAQPPHRVKKDNCPSIELLTALQIKVCDFAYESKLAPIKPYVRRPLQPIPRACMSLGDDARAVPSESQPQNHRALKRTHRLGDGTEERDLGYGFVMGVPHLAPEEG
ncbi:hypothetical protein C8F04DRAFT_1179435 [Mycena alexandri]|uniref:Uncharacterized protein n=1 Tax=Mycena alexandri TaxID=1745969 RepID=A0AAD6T6P3_9AGAR|nr:hypothetical protein C8F04DRAFT_1179435 [Mycena alexandri]